MSREKDLSTTQRAQRIIEVTRTAEETKGYDTPRPDLYARRMRRARFIIDSHDPFHHPLPWSEAVSMKVLKNTTFLTFTVPLRVIFDMCGTTIEGCQFLIDRLPAILENILRDC
ncbi:hypothetical protein HYS94_04030 [Candidatus Daviesbacteria bacterium]|nr:hypothetical protein [Candidatus Daviesbacteria bacterium]